MSSTDGTNPQRVGVNTNIKLFNNYSNSSIQWYYINGQVVPQNIQNKPANVAMNANLVVQGNLTLYGLFIHPSDATLKENVIYLKNGTTNECILNLEPVKYNFINDIKKKERYGLLAQDVEKTFPELVDTIYDTISQTKIKTVNYIDLIPIMLNKMKHMQTEIDILKSEKVNVNQLHTELTSYNTSTLRLMNNMKGEIDTVKKLFKLSKIAK